MEMRADQAVSATAEADGLADEASFAAIASDASPKRLFA
jgi:hypothetical protein